METNSIEHSGHHFIAVFGGSVAGSEAANQLVHRGFRVVVFEQNLLPYGKIEDGLPKWHVKLRDKEEGRINDKIDHPNISFVPGVTLGDDIKFEDLVNNWGFTAVLIATGAWKDRPLPIEAIEDYIDKGLINQNPFIYWFNHYHEPEFNGQQYDIKDNAIVVGGGLASIDVVKALMFVTVENALKDRGIKTNLLELERSIAKVLESNGLTLDDLGLKGCTLYYRRRDADMPLSTVEKDSPENIEKAERVTLKILENAMSKFLFKFVPCHAPVEKIVENGKLVGIRFEKTRIESGRVIPSGEFEEYRSELIISSIGSIPEEIEGMPFSGSTFEIKDQKTCQLEGFKNVYLLGNAVTGRGNIKDSLDHGREISLEIMNNELNWQEEDYDKWLRGTEDNIAEQVDHIGEQIKREEFMPEEVIQGIHKKIAALQQKTGYDGDYRKWVQKNLPTRLEDILGLDH
ncbi:MAG: FAD-dependent oxidoreductase [Bacteroidetes bacterium]|nr:FAD-dependent oxidoreductase [Bacteroidota bacterium]MDA1119386.1 FAD-dependent oxidoreductase [Bacteroidota bacterium]